MLTKTVDLTTFKIHINSVIFICGVNYVGWDIVNYYLETPMGGSEYMRIHTRIILLEIIANNKIDEIEMVGFTWKSSEECMDLQK